MIISFIMKRNLKTERKNSMTSITIENLGTLQLNRVNSADNFKEVCIDLTLPKNVETEYELTDYDASVRFHNDNEVAVFIYDNVNQESTNVPISVAAKIELIAFAKKHI